MSLADPDALECRLCAAEFVGPDRREQYRAHRAEQHPAGEVGLTIPSASVPLAAVPEPRPAGFERFPGPMFACICGEAFETAHQAGGHVGARRTHPDGRKHARVDAATKRKVSGQAVAEEGVSGGGNTPGRTRADAARGSSQHTNPAPARDGEPERPVSESPVTLTGGTVTFQVSVDLSAMPGSLDAVVGALRAALAGLGR